MTLLTSTILAVVEMNVASIRGLAISCEYDLGSRNVTGTLTTNGYLPYASCNHVDPFNNDVLLSFQCANHNGERQLQGPFAHRTDEYSRQ